MKTFPKRDRLKAALRRIFHGGKLQESAAGEVAR